MLERVKRWLAFGMLVALALAAWLWFAGRRASRTPELPQPASEHPAAPRRATVEPSAEPQASREQVPQPAATVTAGPTGIELTLRFIGPDRGALQPASAVVSLTDAEGHVIRGSTKNSPTLLLAGLAPVRYVAAVQAPGFTHRAEVIDLSGHALEEQGSAESLVLWPENWVAVVVLAQDGRPLRTLAAALGMEPKCLFVDAFVARGAGKFQKPPVYQQWQISESVVGALLLTEPPPLTVELLFHGRPVGQESLAAGQTEVVFRLSLTELEKTLARLRLRVLAAQGDTPVVGAKATLRADTSAHRRADQENVPTREDGSVEFTRIVPGRYELTVERGAALYQDRIDIAGGEQRDLGIVRLPDGVPLQIRVVDERGEPQQAWLEIGPFEAGKNVRDLYPPMLHEMTQDRGAGKLPMPARISIVRAQQVNPDSFTPSGRMSASVRIDPAHPPSGEVRLVILDEARVHLICKLPDARTLQLLDESGLIVLADPLNSVRWKDGRRELEFGRGRYTLRLIGAAGEVLYERTLDLRAGEQELELP